MAFTMHARPLSGGLTRTDCSIYEKSRQPGGRASYGARRAVIPIQMAGQKCSRGDSMVRRALQTDTTNTQLGSDKPMTKIAEIQARETVRMPFEAADVESLMSFLRTKQGKLTFINARSVQGVSQISEDLFRCDVGTIGFLGFDVTPSLDLQVTVSENSCRLELVQCRLSTEEAKTSPRFRTGLISSLNLVPEENAESSSAPEYMLVIDTQVFVDLEVYTFPFNKMPASMIEKPGNRLISSVLKKMVPQFLENIEQDWREWKSVNQPVHVLAKQR